MMDRRRTVRRDEQSGSRGVAEQTSEESRVAATRRLLRSAPLTALDTLTGLASQLLHTTAAEVSLITEVRHTVTSAGETALLPGGTTTRLDSLCELVVLRGEPFVVPNLGTDPRIEDRRHLAAQVGAYLGVPMVADDGNVVGSLCVHQREPRDWTDDETELLSEIATAATGHLEIAALTEDYRGTQRAAALEGAAHAAGIGTWDWDVLTGTLVWDNVLLELFGLTPATFGGRIESFNDAVHTDDLAHVGAVLSDSVASGRMYEAEFRIVRPDGTVRWVAARGKPLPDPTGRTVRMIGAVTDLTALREGEARLGSILDTMAVGYLTMDRDWRFTYVNAEAGNVLGTDREELLGNTMWEKFPMVAGSEMERQYRHVAATGETVSFDAYYPLPLDAWFEIRAVPVSDGVGVYFLNITERVAAQEIAERSRDRASTLADVAVAFTENADTDEALRTALRRLVPLYGDWGVVSVLAGGTSNWRTRLRDIGAHHHDPAMADTLEEYRRLRIGALTDSSPVRTALDLGEMTTLVESARQPVGSLLAAGRAHELLTELDPATTAVLPLRGRGRTRGLLTLVRGPERPGFSDEDVSVLEEVRRQIGLGLDNGRLYAEQRGLAEELQLSLLTALPEPDHLQLVARYVAATDGAQIGGDWYDGFMVRDGSTCLVIGDVTGHDRGAAVAMAQVRNVLRGVAHALGDSPARIFEALELAMRDLAVGTLGTAVLAKVEQTPAEAERRVRTLRWSSAGHLPPVLQHADGTTELLERPHDLLLGLDTGLERHDHTVTLRPGDTVLFYTDGLVERRHEDLDTGLERLRRTVSELDGRTPDELCDALLETLSEGREDDVALLVLRVRPDA
jgi:PAS domain S-box-containing protein